MKNVILTVIGLCIVLLTITISFSVFSIQKRKTELEDVVARVTLSVLEEYYTKTDTKRAKWTLYQGITNNLAADAEVNIVIQEMDLQKGILSVKVEERFQQFNGKIKTLVCEKTVLMEKRVPEEAKVYVRFMVGKELYKEFELGKGEICPIPKLPDERILGWAEHENRDVLTSEIGRVWEDKIYVAIMQ